MAVALIQDSANNIPASWSNNATIYSNVEQLFNSKLHYDAIILACQHESMTLENLTALRQHPQFCLHPIFLYTNKQLAELTDGAIDSLLAVEETIAFIQTQLARINYAVLKDAKTRFLAYLFSRESVYLRPQKSWQHQYYYYYPLLNLFMDQHEHHGVWLNQLAEQTILSRDELIDFHFICSYCQAAHIGFAEICPTCHSKQVQACQFLHCFTCGNVAPETEFVRNGQLICQSCHTELRHVGDEYDRPLETGLCLSCREYYIEAELRCTCLCCEQEFASEQLAKQAIYTYRTTSPGQAYIYSHVLSNSIQIFDSINYVEPDYFYALTHWLMQLKVRYPNEVFSLLGIRLHYQGNTPDTSLFAFAEHLRKTLRSTDVLTRLHQQFIWILLPKTEQQGLNVVVDKINEFAHQEAVAKFIQIKLVPFCSEQLTELPDNVELLLAKLTASLP